MFSLTGCPERQLVFLAYHNERTWNILSAYKPKYVKFGNCHAQVIDDDTRTSRLSRPVSEDSLYYCDYSFVYFLPVCKKWGSVGVVCEVVHGPGPS